MFGTPIMYDGFKVVEFFGGKREYIATSTEELDNMGFPLILAEGEVLEEVVGRAEYRLLHPLPQEQCIIIQTA